MSELNLNGRTISISSEDKIYFPESGITKGELIDYYKNIAEIMIPHLNNRPITMMRFPNGIESTRFFQKDRPDYFPKWIKTKEIYKKDGTVCHVICNDAATLVYIANQATITPHIWLSKTDKINNPDKLIIDLDPAGDDFKQVKAAAKICKKFFEEELGMNPYLMTTGSKGLHLMFPLDRKENFDEVREFAKSCASVLAARHSKKLTIEVRKNKREGRLFLDTARNAYAQTSIAPFSVRAREGAPVAAPIEWDELSAGSMNAKKFNIKNIFKRINERGDIWKDAYNNPISLKEARKKLGSNL